jgi:AraC family transcriptional regulator
MLRLAPVRDVAALPESRNTPTALPAPLVSSRYRRWSDVVFELHHFHGVDVVVPVREHIVGVHIAGAVNLLQARGGHARVRHVRPGDITVTPVGEPKRFAHSGDNLVILIKLSPGFVGGVAGEEYALDPARFELVENLGAPDPVAVALGKQMLAALEPEAAVGRLRVDTLKTQIAVHLLRHYCAARCLPSSVAARLPARKLARVLDFIEGNLREDISLSELARVVAMSPSHFAHAFKGSTGLSPHRFVLARRIDRAKSLLRETDLSITDIAHHVGCASHSHFSVMFHRATGLTPRDFRR